jgi:DNA replication initiation complex subunit (GINS family)
VYDELYVAWRREIENTTLSGLPPDFYVRIADYMRRIKEESRMLDRKTVKANLLEHELRHVRRMVRELVAARYRKLVRLLSGSLKVPVDLLTVEEAKICEGFLPFTDAYQRFAKGLLQGQVAALGAEKPHKRVVLRFVKPVPSIIGADLKAYGPFLIEDVASVPVENAKILVKQGLAVVVEPS